MRTVRDLFEFTFRDCAATHRISIMSYTATIVGTKLTP